MNFVGGYADSWWKLSDRFDKALDKISESLDPDGVRKLKLGSPVLVGRPAGDVVRVPVVLLGGPRELPVGYVVVEDVRVNSGRLHALVNRLESRARQMLTDGASSSLELGELSYP